jgi:OOP family OmpA-OmpF porin
MQGVLMVAMIGSFSVAAAQEPFFAGIGIGAAKTRIGNHPLGITGATATSLSRDENDIGGKMFAGYRLYPNWAVEAGYVDLGKTSAKRTMTAPGTGSISLDSRNTGWFVDLVGRMPIGNGVSLIGKSGPDIFGEPEAVIDKRGGQPGTRHGVELQGKRIQLEIRRRRRIRN